MRYLVTLFREDGGGFTIGCPSLPGCWSQGDTEAEALENIADAIRAYLAAVPVEPRIFTREIEVPDAE